jgi:hypothetical protein
MERYMPRSVETETIDPQRNMNNITPDVIVDFIFEQGLLYIALVNIGDAPAHNISVKFDSKIRGVGGSKLVSSISLFKRTQFMPPHKEIKTFLDTSASYFAHKQPLKIKATISFTDREGKKYSNVIKHDLDIYRDIGYIRESGQKSTLPF